MAALRSRLGSLLGIVLTAAAAQAACGVGAPGGEQPDGGATEPPPGSFTPDDGGSGTPTDALFDVEPKDTQTITVTAGAAAPTVAYTATQNGQPVPVAWSLDRGELGTIAAGPASSASFAPSGRVGGLVTVLAGLNGRTVERKILIRLATSQNGADPANPATAAQIAGSVEQLKAGGGVGGVGGEGLGPKVTDAAALAALGAPAGDGKAQGLTCLYPYDGTVWPRGLLAPLLSWDWAEADADAIQIELETTSKSFSWKGTFARPAILADTGRAFTRHPIPQDVWDMATSTAGGPTADGKRDDLVARLTVAKGGAAYGPITQKWKVAPARLSGIIYYNSYGTHLAKNLSGAVGAPDGKFGGAVLSIHVGDTGPKLVAGGDGGDSACRVCHSVASSGSRLIVQRGLSGGSSAYDLDPNGVAVETQLVHDAAFAGLSPDGAFALTHTGALLPLPDDTTPLPVSGLSDVATDLGTPKFSPDGKRIAFNPVNSPTEPNPTQKLMVMDFAAATGTFSAPRVIADYTGQPAETRPGWPAFLPDGASVVFHRQSSHGNEITSSIGDLRTRRGAKAQIHWTSSADAKSVTPLDRLNGIGPSGTPYLPKLKAPITMTCTADGTQVGGIDADHGDDVNLNYEPTVNPVASGGYAWVVFTSRRMYGDVATIPPFCSDPRGVDLLENVTTKKLWVAAIDLDAKPGKDASHPAFYLPGQELLAGNSLGYWVLDPCRTDGATCESGDQCCGGFCRPGKGGALVCTDAPPDATCSAPQEKCTTSEDCCNPTDRCINGFCAQAGPK